MSNNNTKYSLENAIKSIIKYIKWLGIVAVCAVLLSGIVFVQSDEAAVKIRLGKIVGKTRAEQILEPGLHFAFPYIIDKVVKVPVKKIQEIRISDLYNGTYIDDVVNSGYAITGDGNIVLIDAVLKYQITDPIRYAIELKEPEDILHRIAVGELIKGIAGMTVDDVLTVQKMDLSNSVIGLVQKKADELNLGMQVVALEFTELKPPLEVKNDFDMVTSAYVEKTTMVQEAEKYQNEQMMNGSAVKNQIIEYAKSYYIEKTSEASANVAQFYGLLEEYKNNPLVVKERIFNDKLKDILNKIGKTIILDDNQELENILLP